MAVGGVRFLYIPAHDLASMRSFYGGVLGLDEIYFSEDEGSLAYDCGGFQFSIFTAPGVSPTEAGWATQPGWSGATVPLISWSVVLPEERYRRAVKELGLSALETRDQVPSWVGYWSFPVKDPMGNTVEVCWSPEESPQSTMWPPEG